MKSILELIIYNCYYLHCYKDELQLEEDDDKGRDPFIVNERFFSKYAAMLYTSDDNGRTFHEVKDARYCPSCGEKVGVNYVLV